MSFLDRLVPIFPLPNCVVLPGAPQCLHIFEPRYRAMVADELSRPEGERYIAMALLRPGYEPYYCTHQAPIHPTVCIGQIVKCQRLDDGKYNILLLGKARASVVSEACDRGYRRGQLQLCETINDLEPPDETSLLSQVLDCLKGLPGPLRGIASEIAERATDLEDLVDLLTFHVLSHEAVPAKQMILGEPRVDFRAKMLITLVERQFTKVATATEDGHWPPLISDN